MDSSTSAIRDGFYKYSHILFTFIFHLHLILIPQVLIMAAITLLLYFVWVEQRVQPFYNYLIVWKLVVVELWLGSYRSYRTVVLLTHL